MEILNDNEMMKYTGGFKITKTIAVLIAGLSAFILGIVDGLSNPKKCIR